MPKQPSISVIIPAHNEERLIGRSIRSILGQSLPGDEYEIIAVDDASTDKTAYALDLFGSEIHVLRNEKRLGLPGSLNRGIRASRGQYVIRLDADDYVHSDYLYILRSFLDQNKYMDATACDYLLVDENEAPLGRRNWLEHPIGCGIMFRKEQLIDIGLYDDKFLMHEDQDLRLRFTQKYSIHRVELPLYRYRRHENNMTNDKDLSATYEDRLRKKHSIPTEPR